MLNWRPIAIILIFSNEADMLTGWHATRNRSMQTQDVVRSSRPREPLLEEANTISKYFSLYKLAILFMSFVNAFILFITKRSYEASTEETSNHSLLHFFCLDLFLVARQVI